MLVSGGFGAALADWDSPEPGPAIDLVDVDARKDEGNDDGLLVTEEETDEDDTAGGEPPAGAAGLAPLQPAARSRPRRRPDRRQRRDAPAPTPVEARPVPALPAPAGAGGGGDDDDQGGGGARTAAATTAETTTRISMLSRAGPAAARSPPPARGLQGRPPSSLLEGGRPSFGHYKCPTISYVDVCGFFIESLRPIPGRIRPTFTASCTFRRNLPDLGGVREGENACQARCGSTVFDIAGTALPPRRAEGAAPDMTSFTDAPEVSQEIRRPSAPQQPASRRLRPKAAAKRHKPPPTQERQDWYHALRSVRTRILASYVVLLALSALVAMFGVRAAPLQPARGARAGVARAGGARVRPARRGRQRPGDRRAVRRPSRRCSTFTSSGTSRARRRRSSHSSTASSTATALSQFPFDRLPSEDLADWEARSSAWPGEPESAIGTFDTSLGQAYFRARRIRLEGQHRRPHRHDPSCRRARGHRRPPDVRRRGDRRHPPARLAARLVHRRPRARAGPAADRDRALDLGVRPHAANRGARRPARPPRWRGASTRCSTDSSPSSRASGSSSRTRATSSATR